MAKDDIDIGEGGDNGGNGDDNDDGDTDDSPHLAMVAPSIHLWSADQDTYSIWAGFSSPELEYLMEDGKWSLDLDCLF